MKTSKWIYYSFFFFTIISRRYISSGVLPQPRGHRKPDMEGLDMMHAASRHLKAPCGLPSDMVSIARVQTRDIWHSWGHTSWCGVVQAGMGR